MKSRNQELDGKINSNADEQAELNVLMERISSIVPAAVSEWDEYGKVLSLNTDKVYEYMAAEKARLAYINKEQIKSTKKDIERLKKEKEEYDNILNAGKVWAGGSSGYGLSKDQGMRKLTLAEQNEYASKSADLMAQITGATQELDRMTGDSLDKMVTDRIEAQQEEVAARDRFNSMNREQLDAWLKDEQNATDKYLEMAHTIYRSRFQDEDPAKVKAEADKRLADAETAQRARISIAKGAVKSLDLLRPAVTSSQQ